MKLGEGTQLVLAACLCLLIAGIALSKAYPLRIQAVAGVDGGQP